MVTNFCLKVYTKGKLITQRDQQPHLHVSKFVMLTLCVYVGSCVLLCVLCYCCVICDVYFALCEVCNVFCVMCSVLCCVT
jgi:hypothetical protein